MIKESIVFKSGRMYKLIAHEQWSRRTDQYIIDSREIKKVLVHISVKKKIII